MAAASREVEIDGRTVRVSNPTKEYFPGITKADVVDYVCAVGDGLLAAVRDRPTTMERWVDGIAGEAFYNKRIPKQAPDWVGRAEVTFLSGRTAIEVAPSDLATIVWMVNLGTLRFHPWPVRANDTDAVNQLRWDLDPQPGTGFSDAVTVAIGIREVLAEAGLASWVKTSGGRGVHVFSPVAPCDFIDARHGVIAIGREVVRRMPKLATIEWWKESRGERVFIDYNQMARDRTIASAYSIRAVPDATVSAPVTWDELIDCDPGDFTVATMPERFTAIGDLWAGLAEPTEVGSVDTVLQWWERDIAAGHGELVYPPDYPKMPGEPPRVQPSRARTS